MPATKSVALLVPPPLSCFLPQHCFAPSEIMGQPTSPAVKKEGSCVHDRHIYLCYAALPRASEDEFLQSLTQLYDGWTAQYAIWINVLLVCHHSTNRCLYLHQPFSWKSRLPLNISELLIDRNLRTPPAPTLDSRDRRLPGDILHCSRLFAKRQVFAHSRRFASWRARLPSSEVYLCLFTVPLKSILCI